MNVFDQLPKSIKKTVRYILQDVIEGSGNCKSRIR